MLIKSTFWWSWQDLLVEHTKPTGSWWERLEDGKVGIGEGYVGIGGEPTKNPLSINKGSLSTAKKKPGPWRFGFVFQIFWPKSETEFSFFVVVGW